MPFPHSLGGPALPSGAPVVAGRRNALVGILLRLSERIERGNTKYATNIADLNTTNSANSTATNSTRSKLAWRLNRLRCMSEEEIVHRLLRFANIRIERLGLARWRRTATAMDNAPTIVCKFIHIPEDFTAIDRNALRTAADRLIEGRFDVFALKNIDLGTPPRWNRDPKTGTEAPLVFGKLLDYRDPALVGDIKYLWEPNRHLHLVTLAQAYVVFGDERYARLAAKHIKSWLIACPVGYGANWASALEPALRLINWSIAWQLFGNALFSEDSDESRQNDSGQKFRTDWLAAIHAHAEFVRSHYSLHSSANNHLVGEAAGVYIAATTWPLWPVASAWQQEAKAILEREALSQNTPDGVCREQSTAYQHFAFDLFLLPMLAGRANGDAFSTAYSQRLEHMLEFLAAVIDVGGHIPAIGDADDGFVTRLAHGSDFCHFRSLLATGAAIFKRADFKAKSGALDDKTRWLLGHAGVLSYTNLPSIPPGPPVRRDFPDGGYYILGSNFETQNEIRLVADAGPLGYLAIAAHGHADALSFTLSVGGEEFLIDPGTYAYHTEGQWRAYFRGTAAHNTIRIDGQDQSEQGGNFLWLEKATASGRFSYTPAGDEFFEGRHDGYARLPDPVRHTRRIVLLKETRQISIEDTLDMTGRHDIELFFHFHEDCRVIREYDFYRIEKQSKFLKNSTRSLKLYLPNVPGSFCELLCGITSPPAGWVSRSFGLKSPAPMLRWQATIDGQIKLISRIEC